MDELLQKANILRNTDILYGTMNRKEAKKLRDKAAKKKKDEAFAQEQKMGEFQEVLKQQGQEKISLEKKEPNNIALLLSPDLKGKPCNAIMLKSLWMILVPRGGLNWMEKPGSLLCTRAVHIRKFPIINQVRIGKKRQHLELQSSLHWKANLILMTCLKRKFYV
jgi:hypothetical protein